MKKISFAGPSITDKEFEYVNDALKNGWYETFDMHTKKLEKAICDYLGVKHALATHCCTHALHLAALACCLQEGDEVICTDFSWVATAAVISYTGAKPVFVDIDPDTWCIDPDAIKAAITKRTRAIMLVHSFGMPARMDEIMAIAKTYNLKVIEDAAPALGSKFNGKFVGTFGDFGCFSFQGAKIAVSGEGGVIVTNNSLMFEKVKLLASMYRTDSQGTFWCDDIGYEYTIANLTASLALAQVERIDELVAMKRQIFNWYYDRLKDEPKIKMIKEKEGIFSNYCYPSILLFANSRVTRDELLLVLRSHNIHARPAFPRMSSFPMYEQRFANPVCEKVEKYGICLPSALNLTEEDIDLVCQILRKYL